MQVSPSTGEGIFTRKPVCEKVVSHPRMCPNAVFSQGSENDIAILDIIEGRADERLISPSSPLHRTSRDVVLEIELVYEM